MNSNLTSIPSDSNVVTESSALTGKMSRVYGLSCTLTYLVNRLHANIRPDEPDVGMIDLANTLHETITQAYDMSSFLETKLRKLSESPQNEA